MPYSAIDAGNGSDERGSPSWAYIGLDVRYWPHDTRLRRTRPAPKSLPTAQGHPERHSTRTPREAHPLLCNYLIDTRDGDTVTM